MKTLLALISIVLVSFGLSACDAGGTATNTGPGASACDQVDAAMAKCEGFEADDEDPCEGEKLKMAECMLDLADICDEESVFGCYAIATGEEVP